MKLSYAASRAYSPWHAARHSWPSNSQADQALPVALQATIRYFRLELQKSLCRERRLRHHVNTATNAALALGDRIRNTTFRKPDELVLLTGRARPSTGTTCSIGT